MSIATAVLQGGTVLGVTLAPVYNVPTDHTAWVKRAVFTNTGNAAVMLTVSVARSGGKIFTLIPARSIAVGGTDLAPELTSLALASGDGIYAMASVAGAVSAVISGLTT